MATRVVTKVTEANKAKQVKAETTTPQVLHYTDDET